MEEISFSTLKELLILHEGKRNSIYKCSQGFTTIGIGHNLDANPISDRAIDIIFEDDVNYVTASLTEHLPWWITLSNNRKLVLIDMCFNLGIAGLLGFKNTLKAIEEGRYEDAAIGMGQSKWATQVGTRATRLINMMRKG
jgi:lysozyme